MSKLAKGTTRALKYEDIVVKAFELFPGEFALRGYPQFPDSSDIHKPLYGVLKRAGLIRAANKTFSLTERGVETAKRLLEGVGESIESAAKADRMTRSVQLEVDRMIGSAAFKLFLDGKPEQILDTDFYDFVGCTVRTPRNAMAGRVDATGDAVKVAARLGQPSQEVATSLDALWSELLRRYAPLMGKRQ